MELGNIGIWTRDIDTLPATSARDTLQQLEGLGFPTLWFGEDARGREAFTNAAFLLSCTERMVIASGTASIWARDASATASAQRVLAEAWPYRFVLGLGVADTGLFNAHDNDHDQPTTAMRKYLRGMDIRPAGDLANPPEPPARVLEAMTVEMLELARDHAQGALTGTTPPEHTQLARQIVGPGRLLAVQLVITLEADPEQARPMLRRHLARRLTETSYVNELLALGWTEADFADDGSDALLDRLFAWGSNSDIARRVDEHLTAGADHVALRVLDNASTGVPMDQWRALSELL